MNAASKLLIAGVAGAIVLAAVAGLTASNRAAAGTLDTTGTWRFSITGDFGLLGTQTILCSADLTQTGNDAEADFECGIANGGASGTLTQNGLGAEIEADLMIDLNNPFPDIDAHAVGTVSPNGNYMEGTWDADEYNGTFFANRENGAFLNGDLNCDTTIDALDALTAVRHAADASVFQYPGCPEIGSDLDPVFGDLDCNDSVGTGDTLRILQYVGGISQTSANGCPGVGATIIATLN